MPLGGSRPPTGSTQRLNQPHQIPPKHQTPPMHQTPPKLQTARSFSSSCRDGNPPPPQTQKLSSIAHLLHLYLPNQNVRALRRYCLKKRRIPTDISQQNLMVARPLLTQQITIHTTRGRLKIHSQKSVQSFPIDLSALRPAVNQLLQRQSRRPFRTASANALYYLSPH